MGQFSISSSASSFKSLLAALLMPTSRAFNSILRNLSLTHRTLAVTLRNVVLALCSFPLVSLADRNWDSMEIPGAVCGNGKPYKVFYEVRDPLSWSIEFMGGGACWNLSTCYGPTPLALMSTIPVLPPISALASTDPSESPLSGSSYLYLPYCTGDVFSGTRSQRLEFGAVAHKVGRTNVELTLRHFGNLGIIPWTELNSVQLLGSSAGGIGALLNTPFVEDLAPASAKKYVLSDSPGLHFGNRFWKQLGTHFTEDLFAHMTRLGVNPTYENANVAGFLPQICKHLKDWNIAFFQGSRDVVMSGIFGTIAPKHHEKLIFGDDGLWAATAAENDNCAAWIPSTEMHTFFLTPLTSRWNAGGDLGSRLRA